MYRNQWLELRELSYLKFERILSVDISYPFRDITKKNPVFIIRHINAYKAANKINTGTFCLIYSYSLKYVITVFKHMDLLK